MPRLFARKKPAVFTLSLIIVLAAVLVLSGAAYAVKNTTLSPSGDLILSPSGNVGVGKTPVTYKLDVNGIVNATDIYKNGAAFAGGSNVPANTVAAFNQASCPTGWILADGTSGTPDLRGIFIRGAGTNGTRTMANGSAYAATYGTYQNDMMQGHYHNILQWYQQAYWAGVQNSRATYNTTLGQASDTNTGSPVTDGTNGAPRTGAETAPASYALIYCMKTSEDSETSNTIWGTSGSNVFVADISKNVGIGTVSPGEKLEVAGRIKDQMGYVAPVGAIQMYGGSAAPAGWLLCDGSSLSRTGTYADLFAAIGTAYGAADGSHFNIPDFRGIFPRGAGTNGTLKDANNAYFAGTLGTYQNDKFQGHWHLATIGGGSTFRRASSSSGDGQQDTIPGDGNPSADGTNGTPRTGTETNPANLGVNFIIKY